MCQMYAISKLLIERWDSVSRGVFSEYLSGLLKTKLAKVVDGGSAKAANNIMTIYYYYYGESFIFETYSHSAPSGY